MPRTRLVKPGFFDNEKLAECSDAAHLLLIALWQLADRHGYVENRPRRLKKYAFGYKSTEVEPLLEELVTAGFLREVESRHGEEWFECINFTKHQRPHVREPARYRHHTGTTPARDSGDKNTTPAQPKAGKPGKREKGEGLREKGEGRRAGPEPEECPTLEFSVPEDVPTFESFMAVYPRGEDEDLALEQWDAIDPAERAGVVNAASEQLSWPEGTGLNLPDVSKIPYAWRWLERRRFRDRPPKAAPPRVDGPQRKIRFDEEGKPVTDEAGRVVTEPIGGAA